MVGEGASSDASPLQAALRASRARLEEATASCQKTMRESRAVTPSSGQSLPTGAARPAATLRKLHGVHSALDLLPTLSRDARSLSDKVGDAAAVAQRVSGRVRELDEARSRVGEALQRVEDALDVKTCVKGVKQAVERGDFEAASTHVKWYREVARNVRVSSADARGMAEASATVEAAVRARFEEAIDARDAGSVARFSALLEVLGDEEHGASCLLAALTAQLRREGEQALASVPSSVSAAGAAPFPDVLSRALNEGARLVRVHGPTARAHFLAVDGARRLVRTVYAESDAQAAKVVRRYMEGSDLRHRVETLRSALQEGADATDPAAATRATARTGFSLLSSSGSDGSQNTAARAKAEAATEETDTLLSQLAVAAQHCETYLRFLRAQWRRAAAAGAESRASGGEHDVAEPQFGQGEVARGAAELAGLYSSLESAAMVHGVRRALAGDQADASLRAGRGVDEAFFVLGTGVERALATGQGDAVCATVNAAAAVVDGDVRRTLVERLDAAERQEAGGTARARLAAAAVLARVGASEGGDGGSVGTDGDRAGRSPARASGGSRDRGAGPASGGGGGSGSEAGGEGSGGAKGEGDEDGVDVRVYDSPRALLNTPVVLGTLQLAASNCEALRDRVARDAGRVFGPGSVTTAKVGSCLDELGHAAARLEHVVQGGVSALVASMHPSLHALLASAFASGDGDGSSSGGGGGGGAASHASSGSHPVAYDLEGAAEAVCATGDPFSHRVIAPLDAMLRPHRRVLRKEVYVSFVRGVTAALAKDLFLAVTRMRFNQVGALRFDRDIRKLGAYFQAQGRGPGAREALTKLAQAAAVLSQDSAREAVDYASEWGGKESWRLTARELRTLLRLRVDFAADSVDEASRG